MRNDHDDLPDHLSFSQRYGYEPLPEPMKLEELSDDLRREVWNSVRQIFLHQPASVRGGVRRYGGMGAAFVQRVLGHFERKPEDEVIIRVSEVMRLVKSGCLNAQFYRTLNLIEAVLNDSHVDDEFSTRIEAAFQRYGASYRLDTSRRPYRFVPRASREQGEVTQQALEAVEQSGLAPGAATHLRQSVDHLNAGRYADSIKESIHAVESVARLIDPEANKKLGAALKSLERAGLLRHPALREAFDKLYGYTNDEEGIRHALIERDAAHVDVDDALFMYGACASFAAYLINKHRNASKT